MAEPFTTIAQLEAFMAAPKAIAAPHHQGDWKLTHNPGELQMSWPLEYAGEIQPHASLTVVGRTDRYDFFRIMVLCPFGVARLDCTTETHTNSLCGHLEGLPMLVSGPHYHSWPLNKRFFKSMKDCSKLPDAVEFDVAGRNFDSTLRWFCHDNNIEPLPASHVIELPVRENLFGR